MTDERKNNHNEYNPALSGRGVLRIEAPGKLNLDLFVGPRGDDGYHPIDSVAAKVNLCDTVELRLRNDGQINFSCLGEDCGPDDKNLAYLAACAIKEQRCVPGADVTLHKHLPPGSGLGGGSSDAAAVLKGLNDLWRLNLPAGALFEIAVSLGADVPFFLGSPSSRMTGRGENIQSIDVHKFCVVIHLPKFQCATGEVYAAFDSLNSPARRREYDLEIFRRPPSCWRDRLVNVLVGAAQHVYPVLGELREEMSDSLKMPVCLTGSGSGLFVLCDDEPDAARVAASMPPRVSDRCVIMRSGW